MLKDFTWRAVRAARLEKSWLFDVSVPPLHLDGWFRSRRENRCVDLEGNPVPWITYPAIDFLARRIRRDMRVFEYGCGASTLWWAPRVERVIAVDHDAEWAKRIAAQAPANATVSHVPLDSDGAYPRSASEHALRFHVVVIDGRQRVRCVPHAISALEPDGVIVFDNSDRTEYEPGYRELFGAGFRKLEFIGMAPIIDYKSETSIFYRPGNCLGI